MNDEVAVRPLLARFPDARRGAWPLLDPFLLPYLGLMFGSGVAGAAGLYNALALRRIGLALRSLAIGAGGWLAFVPLVATVRLLGIDNPAVAIIIVRIVHFALGGALFRMHRPHHRGHAFLHGRTAPMVATYLVAILVAMRLPPKIDLFLLGGWFVR